MAALTGVGCRFMRATLFQTSGVRVLRLPMSTESETRPSEEPKQKNKKGDKPTRKPGTLKTRKKMYPSESRFKVSFEDDMEKNTDVASSLRLLDVHKIDSEEAVKLVKHISKLVKNTESSELTTEQLQAMLNGKHFEKLTQLLHKQVDQMVLPSLLSSAECLLKMTPNDLFLTKSIETQILWLVKNMNIGNVIKVLSIQKDHQETELRREVWQQCVQTLTQRYTDVHRPQDLISLMYLVDNSHAELLSRLEERAVLLCDSMSAKDMCKVMSLLSQRKRRPKPLLNKLAQLLSKDATQLSMPQVHNLLFSCYNLQVFDEKLLGRLTTEINEHRSEIETPKAATRLLLSYSGLRWRDEDVIDMLSNVIIRDVDSASLHDLSSLLLSCANLDYLPQCLSNQLETVSHKLCTLSKNNARQWLDVVWSCAVLRCLTHDMVTSILDPDFANSLKGDSGGSFTDIPRIKLQNVASAAKHELVSFHGQGLEESNTKIPVRLNRVTLGSVIKALSSVAPADKYLCFDVPHASGFNIDIELVVDSNGNPVAKDALQESGSHRLAIKVLEFPDLMFNSMRPTGLHAMATRHLQYHNYLVIQVLHTEFDKLSTDLQRVQFLEKEIKSVINRDHLKA